MLVMYVDIYGCMAMCMFVYMHVYMLNDRHIYRYIFKIYIHLVKSGNYILFMNYIRV